MDRTYQVAFKALGLSSMNSDGVWETKLETKKPDITRLSDRDYIMTEDVLTNGALVQQTIKLHLPPTAKGARVEKDSFGNAELAYWIGEDDVSKLLTGLGILLAASGSWLFYKSFRMPKSKPVMAAVKPIESQSSEEMNKQAFINANIEAAENEEKEHKMDP